MKGDMERLLWSSSFDWGERVKWPGEKRDSDSHQKSNKGFLWNMASVKLYINIYIFVCLERGILVWQGVL